ncbi:MAG TPA: GspH/FimT family pseudopilin [Gemmatimonadota bacterium]|nr:GspH/FimT family pseudopilin [Gemmatimonadota bacterium]
MKTALPRSTCRSMHGVTLIEILIVMVLVAILAAVAIPRVAGTSDPYEAVEEARRIHAAMAKARATAIAEQRSHRFVLSSGGAWQVDVEASPGTWTATGDSATASGTVTMDGGSSGTVTFYPRGRVDDTHTISVNVDGHVQTLRIFASGLVRWRV